MTRNYNFEKSKKVKQDDKIVSMCIFTIFVCIVFTYLYCSALRRETESLIDTPAPKQMSPVNLETTTQGVGMKDGLPSSVGTMLKAGNACADMQNEMIAENDEYLLEVKNAIKAGYYQRIAMSQRYQELLKTFDKKYMRTVPSGSSTVMWSEFGTWEFNADYDYSAELNATMPVVWICYGKDDTEKKRPYAFLTATYVTASNQFIEPKLFKTEWYPTHSSLYEAVDDEGVVADQCGDDTATCGGNDEANMTKEQLETWKKLQKLLEGEAVKKDAVSISH